MLYVMINFAQGVPGVDLAFLRPNYGQAYNNKDINKKMQDDPQEVKMQANLDNTVPHIFYAKQHQELLKAAGRIAGLEQEVVHWQELYRELLA